MFLDKNSIMIDNVSVGNYILSAEYQYNKLWSSDSGRNLAGTQTGTLIGIFPKIILNFRKLTKTELELFAPIFDKANQTLTYYDPNLKRTNTIQTYTGDWKVVNKHIINDKRKNEGFSISFIAKRKR